MHNMSIVKMKYILFLWYGPKEFPTNRKWSQDNAVSIMTSIRSGWTGNFNPGRSKRFSSAPKHPDQLWAQPASYAMCIWSYVVGVKWPAHQVEHSPPTKVEVKNGWSNTSPTLTFLPQGQLYLLWIEHSIFCSLFQIKVFYVLF